MCWWGGVCKCMHAYIRVFLFCCCSDVFTLTVTAVLSWLVGKALDDLSMEDFDITSIDRELDRERDNDSNSVSSSLSAGLSTSGAFPPSGPIGIPPGTLQQRGSISSLSQSPPSPFGSLPHSSHPLQLHRDTPHDQVQDWYFFVTLTCVQVIVIRKFGMSSVGKVS